MCKHIFGARSDGDLLMDIPNPGTITWQELELYVLTQDRDGWREKVHNLQFEAKGEKWGKSRVRLKTKKENDRQRPKTSSKKQILLSHEDHLEPK